MTSAGGFAVLPRLWDGSWRADPESVEQFSVLRPGDPVTVIKRSPDGQEAARYPATVAVTRAPSPWAEVVATWTHGVVDVAGLVFRPGDTLREFFSPLHTFNAFAVYAPEGDLRGWYGNVTYPAFVLPESSPPAIVWHDLYLDVVILPDGDLHLLDDDELAASGMPESRPDLAAAIVQARRDLIATVPLLVKGEIP